jgi:hypothetical protein
MERKPNPIFKGGHGVYNDIPPETVKAISNFASSALRGWAEAKMHSIGTENKGSCDGKEIK